MNESESQKLNIKNREKKVFCVVCNKVLFLILNQALINFFCLRVQVQKKRKRKKESKSNKVNNKIACVFIIFFVHEILVSSISRPLLKYKFRVKKSLN